jgi:NAD(P)H dehydrogenase (quinone)
VTSDLIAVTGASGALGRQVLDRLLHLVPPHRIVAVVRDPAKLADLAARGVQVRHGDYDDPPTLGRAFANVATLLLISSPELDTARRVRQHEHAIAAATGVDLLAYTSFLGADRPGPGVTEAHHATEAAIRATGRPHVFLRNPFYTDAFVHSGLRAAAESGELTSGTAGRALNTATRTDLAGAAATVLTTPAHEGRAYDLTGPLWTFPELAEVLAAQFQTPISYREQPPPGPMSYLHHLAATGVLEHQTNDLETLLGRRPTTIAQAVSAL